MLVEVATPAMTAEDAAFVEIRGDLLFADDDNALIWKAVLPGIPWCERESATLPRAYAAAIAWPWANISSAVRALSAGRYVLSIDNCIKRLLQAAVQEMPRNDAGAPLRLEIGVSTWSKSRRRRPRCHSRVRPS